MHCLECFGVLGFLDFFGVAAHYADSETGIPRGEC